MIKTNILVIGGSAAGLVAATTAKNNYPDKSVTVIRKEEQVMIPCGIPYVFNTVETTNNNLIPDAGLLNLGVKIVIGEVISIDANSKICRTQTDEEFGFDKLILATGSMPLIPGWLKGATLDNVFTIPKNKVYLDNIQNKLQDLDKIVVIGAGFIGVEVSDELCQNGKQVTLVELLPNVLGATFDDEFASHAGTLLENRGVALKTSSTVKEIIGKGSVEKIILDSGEVIEADAVILSLGYTPNTSLAADMGLELNEYGFIKTDQYRRTNLPDVYAVGDCSEKFDFSTGKLSKIMLASPACTEARIAGFNLYGLTTLGEFRGTIGIYSTCIGETAFGVAGLIEQNAKKEGFSTLCATFTGVNRHPGKIADAHQETIKLIFLKQSGVILGGEISGGKDAGELLNVIGLAIQNHMTVFDLLMMQIGTHPLLTASPAAFTLIKTAELAVHMLNK